MTTVHIVLRDTEAGLVDVETTVAEWDPNSPAQNMAAAINSFLSTAATEIKAPELRPQSGASLGAMILAQSIPQG